MGYLHAVWAWVERTEGQVCDHQSQVQQGEPNDSVVCLLALQQPRQARLRLLAPPTPAPPAAADPEGGVKQARRRGGGRQQAAVAGGGPPAVLAKCPARVGLQPPLVVDRSRHG